MFISGGVVDDKSARDVVSKFLLLDADKPGEEIKFYINSPGGVVTSGMVMYDTNTNDEKPGDDHLYGSGRLDGKHPPERWR